MYTCLAVVLHSISVILTQSETIHRYLTIYRKYVESVVVTIHSRLPLIRTFKGNRKKFELSRVRVVEVKLYRKWSEGKWKFLRVSGRFELSRVRVTGSRLSNVLLSCSLIPCYKNTQVNKNNPINGECNNVTSKHNFSSVSLVANR